MRLLAAVFAFLSLTLATLGLLVLPRLPPNWIPWKAPILDAPPAWAAHLQINRLKADRAACLNTLEAASRMTFVSEPDRSMDHPYETLNKAAAPGYHDGNMMTPQPGRTSA